MDSFLLAPTALGKSLAFQLPSLTDNILTVVVSPLRSLIEDQVASLQHKLVLLGARGTACHGLHEAGAGTVVAEVCDLMLGGISEAELQPGSLAFAIETDPNLRFAYVTPEGLENPYLQTALSRRHSVLAYALDEAHCITSWVSCLTPCHRLRFF